MNMSPENYVKRVITKLNEFSQSKPSASKNELFSRFVSLYYAHMPHEDFEHRSLSDLYATIWSHWELVQTRKPGEIKISVFNPKGNGKDDWQSTHTIIQIVMDDMPFLVDSIRMEINKMHLTTHLTIHSGGMRVCRNAKGQLSGLFEHKDHSKHADQCMLEAPIHLEVDRQTDVQMLKEIEQNLRRVLNDASYVVHDWSKMRDEMQLALHEMNHCSKAKPSELEEERSFLEWLLQDHFTFLGYRDYRLVGEGEKQGLEIIPESGLGVLRDSTQSKSFRPYNEMPARARKIALSNDQSLIISKTNTMSTVHRPAYTDYIGVKHFNDKGELTGERRFIGLYTSVAYRSDPRYIPILRRKVESILERSNLPQRSHAAKDLIHILSTLPRDDLFHSSTEELYELANAISHLQERRRTRLFLRKDLFGRYFSCLVYVPRENFNTDLVSRVRDMLQAALHGTDITYSTRVTESVLARIHYTVRIDSKRFPSVDVRELEKKVINIAESWQDSLRHAVLKEFGEELGNAIFNRYRFAFPAGYREVFNTQIAISDIKEIERLGDNELGMLFYRPVGALSQVIRFKLYHSNETIPLSDALPMLENMGLRVIGEQPYRLVLRDGKVIWINDFNMRLAKEPNYTVEEMKDIFQEAFQRIWRGEAESDSFNRLVLEAALDWRDISLLRAYTRYFRQISFTFSDAYIANALVENPVIAKLIVDLYKTRFDPKHQADTPHAVAKIAEKIASEIENVTSLDEDRILTRFVDLIGATLRTNFYQKDGRRAYRPYLVFKLDPSKIPDMPKPLPRYEIFVYSPRFEGVHLRMAKVARGGIRWSDRKEDFRTEVLGLMKAQQVKNALIVPEGAKGGFLPKRLPVDEGREAVLTEAVHCYEGFISGLLDVTDNLVEGKIIHPDSTICLDGEDPYLVVAADKGTATFSDIANRIAISREYWMGDAFASGGSSGYDHKKMGITARGAWVSAQRHFQELGIDLNKAPVKVVGIGDMSGDVFGNGMLCSPHLKLVAAFNHMHIFIDPDPDAKASYEERKRLFELPRSTWADYDAKLISKGGGVFPRSAKAIVLTEEIQKLIGVNQVKMVPSELIRALLKADVDMIWNGGIGTYVKASTETDGEVGDRTNDILRVNGCDLRTKVFCEGGNLGLTQRGRIEYALQGGKINTDFIDNSGGVDCSDNEVNIKILLNPQVASGFITERQRNALLSRMTNSVPKNVLEDNYHQSLAISMAFSVSHKHMGLYRSFIHELESEGKLDRELEFLPDDREIQVRRAENRGFTRPELAILFAYSKNVLKKLIKRSDLIDDPYLAQYVHHTFPNLLEKRFGHCMDSHYLAKDIIATELTNRLVAEMGITFVYQMHDETGAAVPEIVRAYIAARKIFDLSHFYRDIELLDYKVDTKVQYEMLLNAVKLVRRATRWLLRNRQRSDIESMINEFRESVEGLLYRMPKLLIGEDKVAMDAELKTLIAQNVPESIASKIAATTTLYHALNIELVGFETKEEVFRVAKIYFMLADRLNLFWFRDQINQYPINDRWTLLAKAAYKCDLDAVQRELTISVLRNTEERSIPGKLKAWMTMHTEAIERWQGLMTDLRGSEKPDFAILFVAIRELIDMSKK